MREIWGHRPGRIFLAVLFLSIIIMLYIPKYFYKPVLLFGWITAPFLSGIVFTLIWLIAYLVYFFGYWPFRH